MLLSVAVIFAVVVVVIFLLVLLWGVGSYNGLVSAKARFQNAFAQIDVQLKRRYDLIPNLVETARGFMRHERETLEAVVAARNQAASALQALSANPADPGSVQRLLQAEQGLGGVMGRLMAVSEAYPELKANQNMMQLTEELTSTENKVSFARQGYNDAVTSYNVALKTFPTVLIASFLGFQEATLFEVKEAAEKEAPKVNFS
jgi:LemA protein